MICWVLTLRIGDTSAILCTLEVCLVVGDDCFGFVFVLKVLCLLVYYVDFVYVCLLVVRILDLFVGLWVLLWVFECCLIGWLVVSLSW